MYILKDETLNNNFTKAKDCIITKSIPYGYSFPSFSKQYFDICERNMFLQYTENISSDNKYDHRTCFEHYYSNELKQIVIDNSKCKGYLEKISNETSSEHIFSIYGDKLYEIIKSNYNNTWNCKILENCGNVLSNIKNQSTHLIFEILPNITNQATDIALEFLPTNGTTENIIEPQYYTRENDYYEVSKAALVNITSQATSVLFHTLPNVTTQATNAVLESFTANATTEDSDYGMPSTEIITVVAVGVAAAIATAGLALYAACRGNKDSHDQASIDESNMTPIESNRTSSESIEHTPHIIAIEHENNDCIAGEVAPTESHI